MRRHSCLPRLQAARSLGSGAAHPRRLARERRHDGAALRLLARRAPRVGRLVAGDHAAWGGAGLPSGAAASCPHGGRHRRSGGALDRRGGAAGRRYPAAAHVRAGEFRFLAPGEWLRRCREARPLPGADAVRSRMSWCMRPLAAPAASAPCCTRCAAAATGCRPATIGPCFGCSAAPRLTSIPACSFLSSPSGPAVPRGPGRTAAHQPLGRRRRQLPSPL